MTGGRNRSRPALLHTGGVSRLRVVLHTTTACAVLALAVAVGRWLRDPEPGAALVGIVVLGLVVGLCAHRLYRDGGIGRTAAVAAPEPVPAPAPVAAPPPPLWMTSDLLDLNYASLRELQTLPGVGKVTAERIIAQRPFNSVDDLARVGGLGPARIRAIAERARTS